jgi:hypothetical protein
VSSDKVDYREKPPGRMIDESTAASICSLVELGGCAYAGLSVGARAVLASLLSWRLNHYLCPTPQVVLAAGGFGGMMMRGVSLPHLRRGVRGLASYTAEAIALGKKAATSNIPPVCTGYSADVSQVSVLWHSGMLTDVTLWAGRRQDRERTVDGREPKGHPLHSQG